MDLPQISVTILNIVLQSQKNALCATNCRWIVRAVDQSVVLARLGVITQSVQKHLRCNAGRANCGLRREDEAIVCICGCRYPIVDGVLDLRLQGGRPNSDTNSKYFDDNFVASFVARQYGDRVKTKPDDQAPLKIFARIGGGAEQFYQTVSALCGHFLDRNSEVLDIGCGTGRLTAEIGRKGVSSVLELTFPRE